MKNPRSLLYFLATNTSLETSLYSLENTNDKWNFLSYKHFIPRIENMANTIDGDVRERLDPIPSNIQQLFYILIISIFYG